MPENSNADGESDKTKKNNNRAQHKVVWAIVAGGIIGVLVILFVSLFFPNLTERTKFFTTNALSALLLDVIIVQAYIYRKQWEAMREQRNTMNDQLSVMRASENTLKRQADAFDAQVAAMQGQLEAMNKQAEIMNGTLQQTRSIISQNDRAIDAARDMARAAEASVEVAERNVEIAHDHMWHAQRAYLAPTEIHIDNRG
jgi:hypothetical protein